MAAWLIWTAGLATAAAGLALTMWALLWDRSRGRRRCPRCWYVIAERAAPVALPATCPECGRVARRPCDLHRTRRRWILAAAGVVAAIAAGWVAPVSATRGWWATMPAPAIAMVIDTLFAEEANTAFERACVWRAVSTPWERRLACRGLAQWLRPMIDGEPYDEWLHHPAISNFAYRNHIVSDPAAGRLVRREALDAMFHESNSPLRELGARLVAQMPEEREPAMRRLEQILATTDDPRLAMDAWIAVTELNSTTRRYRLVESLDDMRLSAASRRSLVAFIVAPNEYTLHLDGVDWALRRALDVRRVDAFLVSVRRSAAIGLSWKRPPDPETTASLLAALNDPDDTVREAAQQSLEELGHTFPPIGPGGP